jgi:glycosyltransferase involved in cell wall biosynthesis
VPARGALEADEAAGGRRGRRRLRGLGAGRPPGRSGGRGLTGAGPRRSGEDPLIAGGRVLSGLFFFPRGGSAQVARSLCRALPAVGWRTELAAGSLGAAGELTHAPTFFAGLELRAVVDYTAAARLADPLGADVPFQPSYEDRPGSPDRVFAAVADEPYERLVAAWRRALDRAGAAAADVLHLHHLTPANEAAVRAFPGVPVVGQLHNTELALLREIERGAPPAWPYAERWAERMRGWAAACRALVSHGGAETEAARLLGVPAERIVGLPVGIDPDVFDRRPRAPDERVAFWREWLVADGRGWDESGVPGSVRYRDEDLRAFADGGPVLLYVGRYTEVKRLPLLVRAYARARRDFPVRAPLVLVGGFPGEWEGEHPLAVVRATGAQDVFLAGWRPHDELPQALNASDLLVLPSVREGFGLVLVEAMACGLPVVAVDAHGPARVVDPGETGWLVPPDDEDALARALGEAVADEAERRRRGEVAYERSRERYAWPSIAAAVARVYEDARTADTRTR